jgi:TRAP-type C4-dicarboxylate transport system permease small subunit
MESVFRKTYEIYGKLVSGFAIFSGYLCFLMMWTIDVNAISRKVLNAPVPGGYEAAQSMLTILIMLPFAYTLLKREHVRTTVLTSKLPADTARNLLGFWMVIGFFVFAAVTWGTFLYALRAYNIGEEVWGATVRFAVWPAKMAVSFGCVLISIQFLFGAIDILVFGDKTKHPDEHEPLEEI